MSRDLCYYVLLETDPHEQSPGPSFRGRQEKGRNISLDDRKVLSKYKAYLIIIVSAFSNSSENND